MTYSDIVQYLARTRCGIKAHMALGEFIDTVEEVAQERHSADGIVLSDNKILISYSTLRRVIYVA